MEKILVTTDGSENATKALLKAKEVAKVLGREVIILSVVEEVTSNPYLTIDYTTVEARQNYLLKLTEEILKEALKHFEDFHGDVNTKILKGNPSEMIIKEINDNDYDMVIMGSRGLGTFSKTVLGSVSYRVLNHSKIDVLIVK